MKTSSKIGKGTSINLVDDTTEMMVISQFGKIIRIDTKSVRSLEVTNITDNSCHNRPIYAAYRFE
jgi:hypothetical protein